MSGLTLDVKIGDCIVIDHRITVTVRETKRRGARLTIEAPPEISVNRRVIEEAIVAGARTKFCDCPKCRANRGRSP